MNRLVKFAVVTRIFILLLAVAPACLTAQVKLPVYPDSLFNTYYYQRVSFFESMPRTNGDIIFLGNSITDGGE